MFRSLVLGAIFIACATVADAQERWITYHNSRFGTSIEYPSRFRLERPPDNNDGQSFTASDGAGLRVWGSLNIEERDIAALEQFVREAADKDERITYRANGKNWLVLSGTRGANVFYTRYLLSHRNGIENGLEIEYPAALAAAYDPIVARISKSLKAGRGYQTTGNP